MRFVCKGYRGIRPRAQAKPDGVTAVIDNSELLFESNRRRRHFVCCLFDQRKLRWLAFSREVLADECCYFVWPLFRQVVIAAAQNAQLGICDPLIEMATNTDRTDRIGVSPDQ